MYTKKSPVATRNFGNKFEYSIYVYNHVVTHTHVHNMHRIGSLDTPMGCSGREIICVCVSI